MNRIAQVFSILFFLLIGGYFGAYAQEVGVAADEPVGGSALCSPAIYRNQVKKDCLPMGPVQHIAEMAEIGIHLPYQKLAYENPDYELTYVPYLYGKIVTSNAPAFGSAQAAAKGRPVLKRLETGFSYISYTYTEVIDGVRVYMIAPGVWMNANDVHRVSSPTFQGLIFERTPKNPFGWILQQVETMETPGYQTLDYTGNIYYRFNLVQIYGEKTVDGVDWFMIRPGEWIEHRMIARVVPNPTPPQGVEKDRWIDINLYEQTVSIYENHRLVYATLISSGIDPFWTRPGLFQVYEKLESTPMSGAFEPDRSDYYYLEDVPWTMYFDKARALHGAYWHTFYGYPRSHGCVNLAPGDARWIFNWAEVGDWVYVHDPSGQTPVDESLYTAGGA